MIVTAPYRYAAAATDPNFASVALLLHFEGADASTTFVDVKGKTLTANGNAQIDTAQFKYGSSSGLFDGTGDYVDSAASSDYTFGTGDFTIECFAMFANIGATNKFLWGHHSGWGVYTNTDDIFVFNGTSNALLVNNVIAASTWHHIAFTRQSGVMRLYLDGAQIGSNTPNSQNFNTTNFRVGAQTSGSGGMNGWIDELRVTKGVARYTGATYTVPTGPFPDS
jgi:hypothetical protein